MTIIQILTIMVMIPIIGVQVFMSVITGTGHHILITDHPGILALAGDGAVLAMDIHIITTLGIIHIMDMDMDIGEVDTIPDIVITIIIVMIIIPIIMDQEDQEVQVMVLPAEEDHLHSVNDMRQALLEIVEKVT